MYESFLQKIYEDKPGKSLAPFIWNMDEIADYFVFSFRGIVRKIAERAPKAVIKAYSVKVAKKLARKVAKVYNKIHGNKLTEKQLEAMFNDVFDYLIEQGTEKYLAMTEEEIIKQENQDVAVQETNYIRSVSQGHGVIIVAHSQGNLFTNRVYEDLKFNDIINKFAWIRQYISAIGIASPANNILGKKAPYMTFDNDMIQLVFDSLPANVINPRRYHIKNAIGEDLGETLYSVKAHSFLTSYMATDITRNAILGFINGKIAEHEKRPSQWKIDREFNCGCDEQGVYVKHVLNKYPNYYALDRPGLRDILHIYTDIPKYKIRNFSSKNKGKLYLVNKNYVYAKSGGVKIEDGKEKSVCKVLLDENGNVIGKIDKKSLNKKKGLIEADLNWTNPNIDLDLSVEGLKGEYDVKDIDCPTEHFVAQPMCKTQKYKVIVFPKFISLDMSKDKTLYPLNYNLTIKTADGRGGYNKMVVPVTINSISDFVKYRHIADIVIRCKSDSSVSYNGDNGYGSSKGGIIITPVIPPDCPPIPNVKLPNRKPKPIYTYGGGGYFGDSGTWYGGGGDGKHSYSGQSVAMSVHMPIQQIPECGGSIDCIPKAQNDESSGGDSSNKPESYAPPALAYGGVPTLPIEKKPKKECKGKYDCGCMPCEYKAVRYTKSVQLGPISDANYSIYTLDGYRNNLPLYSGKTTKGTNLYDSGIVDLPIDILNSLDNDKLYILEVKGGIDIDANDDFIIDKKPTINKGYIYTVATGKDIKALGFKANILTTMAFTLIKDMIENRESQKKIEKRLDLIASRVLRDKIYEDKTEIGITNRDLILWLPTIDKDMLLKPYNPLEKMVQKIYKNEDIYEDAYRYVFDKKLDKNETIKSKPIIKTFVGEIPEDAKAGDIVGKIEVLRGEGVVFDELRGNDAKDFTISKDGVIRVSNSATIDYEHRWRYDLIAKAHNKYGDSGDVRVFINVKNVPDAPEFVQYIGGSVDENATGGTKIGQVIFKPAGAKITKIELVGKYKDLFKIDLDGNIYLKEGAKLDFEKSMYYGFWVFAYNKYGRSLPTAVYIIVKNIPDTPEISNYKGGNISEDAKGGAIVGKLIFKKGGSDISRAYLSDFNDTFTIDTHGIIRLKSGAKLDYEKRAFYKMDAILENSFGKSSYPVFVRVVDVLDVPQLISFEGGNVDEYADIGTVVGELKFNEGKAPIDKIVLSGRDASYFSIDSSGVLRLAKRVDYEDKSELLVTVNAYNKLGKSRDVKLHIFVNDEVEREPSLANSSFSVLENASVGEFVGKITVCSKGASDIESFKLVGDGKDSFRIDKDGKVYLAKELDYSKRAKYKFDVYAINKYGVSKGVKLIINVIRHTVPILDDTTLSVSESAKIGDIVGKVKVVSEGGSKIDSFKIVEHLLKLDLSKIPFKIDNSGAIRVSKKLDYEHKREYRFEVSATNSYGSRSAIVTVKVLNAADALPDVLFKIAKVAENKPKGSVVGTIEARSDSKIEKYEINGTKDFVVDSNGTIKTNRVFDYEKEKEFKFKVRVKNRSGYSKWGDYVVKIVDTNDTVPVLENSFFSIKENAKVGDIVGKVKIISLGGSKIDSFKIVNNSSNLPFKIDRNGVISLVKKLDYESKKEYIFEVKATNSYGDGRAIVTVYVLNVADSLPVIVSKVGEIKENKPKGSIVGTIEARSDSKIEKYEINGTKDFVVDSNGTIKTNRVFDYEKEKEFKFKVRVKNRSGYSKWSDYTVKIVNVSDTVAVLERTVLSVNENAKSGDIVGKIKIITEGDSPIEYFKILKINEQLWPDGYFKIDSNGTIKVDKNASLDYETRKYYETSLVAVNKSGESNRVYLTINVNNVSESLPKCVDKVITIGPISKNLNVGKVLKDYIICDGVDSNLKSVKIEPKSPFGVRFKKYSLQKYIELFLQKSLKDSNKSRYDVTLKVSNEFGSIKVPVTVYISDSNYMYEIFEDSLGLRVGKITLGNKEIAKIDTDSQYFDIDRNGTLRRNSRVNYGSVKQYNFNVNIDYKNGSKKVIPVVVNVKSRIITEHKFMNHINKMVFDKNRSLVYLGGDRLVIVDLNSSNGEKVLSDIETNNILDMAVSKDRKYLYMLEEGNGLKIINIKDLSNLKVVSKIELSGGKLALYGNIVAVDGKKIKIVDVSDKSNPKIVKEIGFLGKERRDEYGKIIEPGSYYGVEIVDGILYTELWYDKLQAIDIKDINNPKLIYSAKYGTSKRGFYLNKKQKILFTDSDNDAQMGIYKISSSGIKQIRYSDKDGSNDVLLNNSAKLLEGSFVVLSDAIYDLYNISDVKPIYYHLGDSFSSVALSQDKESLIVTKGGSLAIFTLKNLYNLKHMNSNIVLPPSIDDKLELCIDENVTNGTKIGSLKLKSDLDIKRFECYGFDCKNFTINNNGELFVSKNADIDYEKQKRYKFAVVAKSERGNSNYATVTIKVNNVYDVTPKIKGFNVEVKENNKAFLKIGKVIVLERGDSLISAFEINNTNEFFIDENGTVFTKVSFDYEKQKIYNLKVRAKNKAGWSEFANIHIAIKDLNDTVPILADTKVSIKENAKINQKIGKIKVLSIGGDEIEDFGFENSKNLPFGIDKDGNIIVLDKLDFDKKNRYELKAFAKNSYGKGFANVIINILDLKKPKLIATTFKVPETIEPGAKIGQVKIETNGDENITLFELYGDEAKKFSIDKNGILYLKDNQKLDFESKSSYKFKVTASSIAGKSEAVDINIIVLDEGKPPVIRSANFVVSKDMPRDIGSFVGILNIDNNDGKITDIKLSGKGAEDFNIDRSGKITFATRVEDKKEYYLKAVAVNKFGKSNIADVHILVKSIAKIDAGADITVREHEEIRFKGMVSNLSDVKEIIWISPDSDKINCSELRCAMANSLLPGVYTVIMKVTYKNGLVLEDSLQLRVLKDSFDKTIATLDKKINGTKDIKISKNKKFIYVSGKFEDGTIFKIIDVSNPANMHIVASYIDDEMQSEAKLVISDDESKAVLLNKEGIVILDISNIDNIKVMSKIEANDEISIIKWYKNNQFIYYDKINKDIYLVNVNTLEKRKIYHYDKYIDKLFIIKSKNILIVGNNFIDIDNSKVLFTLNDYYDFIYVDEIHSDVYLRDFNGNFKVLNSSNKNNIHFYNVKWQKLLKNRLILDNDSHSFYLYNSQTPYNYNLLSRLFIGDKNYFINIASFKGGVDKAFIDVNSSVAYVYNIYNGLRAVKIDNNSSYKFLNYIDIDNLKWFTDKKYAYGFDKWGVLKFFKDSNNKLEEKGKVEIRLACYPDCGYNYERGNRVYYSLRDADISDDLLSTNILYSDNTLGHIIIDISDKEKDTIVNLDKNVSLMQFYYKVIKNNSCVATIEGINSQNAVLHFKAKDLFSDVNITLNNFGFIFTKMEELEDKNRLIVMANNSLYMIDISNLNNPQILDKILINSYFSTFIFSKERDKLYLLASDSTLYRVSGLNENRLNIDKVYKLDNKYLYNGEIAISPSGEKLFIAGAGKVYILSSELKKEKTILYPETNCRGISFKNNNVLFVNGYIIKLNK